MLTLPFFTWIKNVFKGLKLDHKTGDYNGPLITDYLLLHLYLEFDQVFL